MIQDQLKQILGKAQANLSCHEKYLKILQNLYNQAPFDDFCKSFVHYLEVVFAKDVSTNNPYIERYLEFCARFCTLISEEPSYPFLTRVIRETLEFHDLRLVQARYYSCKFIMLLLQNIASDAQLDDDVCDSIQEAMLERIMDPKPQIRLQAITALVRLQDPLNLDCPVINAYLSCLNDESAVAVEDKLSNKVPMCKKNHFKYKIIIENLIIDVKDFDK